MKEVEIVFTKSKKLFPVGSLLIRLWTRRSYSHIAYKIQVMGETLYYHSSEGKVNYEHESVFNRKHEIVQSYTVKVPENIYINIKQECFRQAGENYGFMQNLGIVLMDIADIFSINMKNPWKKGKNCSELIYLCIISKMYPNYDLDANYVKPHHIENILISELIDNIPK